MRVLQTPALCTGCVIPRTNYLTPPDAAHPFQPPARTLVRTPSEGRTCTLRVPRVSTESTCFVNSVRSRVCSPLAKRAKSTPCEYLLRAPDACSRAQCNASEFFASLFNSWCGLSSWRSSWAWQLCGGPLRTVAPGTRSAARARPSTSYARLPTRQRQNCTPMPA